jgi:hypothetical protein
MIVRNDFRRLIACRAIVFEGNRNTMGNDESLRRYSFVTVRFEGDAGLLDLQARSMRQYCPRDLVDEIIIVDNSCQGSTRWQGGLLRQYGDLADRVQFIPAAVIAAIPKEANGWFSQQVLKIKVAEIVRSDRYVLLDAKNHLVSPLGREFLESSTGQPRTNGYPYGDQPMLEYLERTLQYLGLDPQAHVSWFTRTTTPFILLAGEARELVEYIEEREGRSFAAAFLDRGLSEFFLYAGFLELKGTLREIYDITQPHEPQVWPDKANGQGCAEVIRKAEKAISPFMTVHRKAIARMDGQGQRLIAEFWFSRGLFASTKDGIRFLMDPNRSYQSSDGHVISRPLSTLVSRFMSRPAIGLQTP